MSKTTTSNQNMKWEKIPLHPLGSVPQNLPDDDPRLYRLIIAKRALLAGYVDAEQPDQTITDALADLRLLCDELGLDFAALDRKAYDRYLRENGSMSASA